MGPPALGSMRLPLAGPPASDAFETRSYVSSRVAVLLVHKGWPAKHFHRHCTPLQLTTSKQRANQDTDLRLLAFGAEKLCRIAGRRPVRRIVCGAGVLHDGENCLSACRFARPRTRWGYPATASVFCLARVIFSRSGAGSLIGFRKL